jgi:CSLREA domain-containing protein
MHTRLVCRALLLAMLVLLGCVGSASASNFVVTSTGDASDLDTSDGVCAIASDVQDQVGPCTLRAAVEQANAAAGSDSITFSVSGEISPASTITLGSTLTMSGCGGATGCAIDGSNASPALDVTGASVLISGIRFHGGSPLRLAGTGATVRSSTFGSSAAGTSAAIDTGVVITGDDSTIGGSSAGLANVFCGAATVAIDVNGGDRTQVIGNRIGMDGAGTPCPVRNQLGVLVEGGSNATTIGGMTTNLENAISLSRSDAIRINGAGTGTDVQRNTGDSNAEQWIDVGSAGPGSDGGAPTVTFGSTLGMVGTASANAVVRVFATPAAGGAQPSGVSGFVGSTTANASGAWTLSFPTPQAVGAHLTALQVRPNSGVGELSPALVVAAHVAPETTITDAPSGRITGTSATVTATITSPLASKLECSIDGQAYAPCTSPVALTNLAEGQHSVFVRGRDALGQVDASPAAVAFSVAVPPDTSITQAPNGTVGSSTGVFGFDSDDPAATFTCSIDEHAWFVCESTTTVKGFGLGRHTFAVRATDAFDNVDPTPATVAFVVVHDTVAPVAKLGSNALRATKAGVVSLTVSCPATEVSGPCTGSIALISARRLTVRRGVAQRVVQLGTVKFSVEPGDTRTVTLRLTKANRALLARLRAIAVKAKITTSDSQSNTSSTTRALTLRSAPLRGSAAHAPQSGQQQAAPSRTSA